MNRRGFLRALVAAPIAVAVAPLAMARPAFATGGIISGSTAVFGEYAGEAIFPADATWISNPAWTMSFNPARVFQSQFEAAYGMDEANTAIFDANAAYCDELVEADIADPSPAA